MYCNFYGLSERPFDVTPDPKFFYDSPSHRETLASLIYGIRERRGFIAMVGEVGTGKTMLLKALLDRIDENTKVAYIFNTDVTYVQMLNMALVDLGLANSKETLSKVEALHRLNDYAIQQFTKGANVVFMVDEAQNLDRGSMENLRLLSNLETRKHKLIQIVLSGQPELDTKLNKPELRQLAQRISLKRYITPLGEKEAKEYIRHRLAIAECKDRYLFSIKAQQLIWHYSGGIPRKINMLCDNALLIGYGLKQRRIKSHVVEEAIKDLSWSPFTAVDETPTGIPEVDQVPQSGPIAPDSPLASATSPTALGIEEKAHLLEAAESGSRFVSAVTQLAIDLELKARELKEKLPQTWFTSTKGLVIAASIIFIVGLLIGKLWFSPGNSESPVTYYPVPAKVKTQTSPPEQHPQSPPEDPNTRSGIGSEVALANVPEEKPKLVYGAPSEHAKENETQTEVSSLPKALEAPSSSKGPKADKAPEQAQLVPDAQAAEASEVASVRVPEEKPKLLYGTPSEQPKEDITELKVSSLPKGPEALSLPKDDEALSSPKGSKANNNPHPAPPRGRAYTPAGVASGVAVTNIPETKPTYVHGKTQEEPRESVSTLGTEDKQAWKFIIVQPGDIFSKLVARVYGRANENNLNLVHEFNPHIPNPDWLEVGQKIIFPPPYTEN